MTLRCPFSNCTYSSFPNFILFRLANYWLVLIYDFAVSGLLKIKLISSICFHRIRPKILVFQSLTSHLTPFSLVWGHEINHSKQNVLSSLLHRNDLSCHRWRRNLFIKEWPQDFHERTFCDAWNLALPVAIPHHNSKTYPLKNTVIQGTIWIIF